MTWDTLLRYAQDSPLLLAALVGAGGVLATVERVFALTGPVTRLAHWWQGRELAKLKREALLRAEKRRIEAEEASAREKVLEEENAWLRGQLRAARATRPPAPADTSPTAFTRNRARPPVPRR